MTPDYLANFIINQLLPLEKEHKVLYKSMPIEYIVQICEMQYNKEISKSTANELIEHYCIFFKEKVNQILSIIEKGNT